MKVILGIKQRTNSRAVIINHESVDKYTLQYSTCPVIICVLNLIYKLIVSVKYHVYYCYYCCC